MGQYASGRLTRSEVERVFEVLSPILSGKCAKFELSGSYRRGKEDIGDIDLVVADCNLPELDQILQQIGGKLKFAKTGRVGESVLTEVFEFEGKEIQVEFVNVPEKCFGAGLLHSTSGKEFNISFRTYAKQKGYTLSQYGLIAKDGTAISETEEAIFNALGLRLIPPTERNVSFWKIKDQNKLPK